MKQGEFLDRLSLVFTGIVIGTLLGALVLSIDAAYVLIVIGICLLIVFILKYVAIGND